MDVAASVIGIVAFAFQALKAINGLRDFCAEFAEDASSDFLHDLDMSASILTNVKVLCEEVQQLKSGLKTDFRTASLSIQVEDCSRDLQRWLLLAKRFKGSPKPLGALQLRAQSLRSVWQRFLSAASKGSRMKLREQLQWHRDNINMTLSIFGRKFELMLIGQNDALYTVTEAVHGQISHEAGRVMSRLDSLSSDSGSLLAHSRSTVNRLNEVRTSTSKLSAEMREMKSLLVEVLSSHSSQTSSRSEDAWKTGEARSAEAGGVASLKKMSNQFDADCADRISRIAGLERGRGFSMEKLPPTLPGNSAASEGSSTSQEEPEFETLSRATTNLVDALRSLWHPMIAEYISTASALKTCELLVATMRANENETMSIEGHHMFIDRGNQHLFEGLAEEQSIKAKAQLLKLRKVCKREGLSAILQRVDDELGIEDEDIASWTKTTHDRASRGRRLQLWKYPKDAKAEASVRIEEWMLGVIHEDGCHRAVYQTMFTEAARARFWESDRRVGTQNDADPGPVAIPDDELDRYMLKLWFLGPEGRDIKYAAASEFAPSTVESQATIVPVPSDDTIFDEDDAAGGIEDGLGAPQLLRNLHYPHMPLDLCKGLEHLLSVNSDSLPAAKMEAASRAQEAYTGERSGYADEERDFPAEYRSLFERRSESRLNNAATEDLFGQILIGA